MMPGHRRLLVAVVCAMTVLTGCTSGATLGSSGTVTLITAKPGKTSGATTASTVTTITPTPVTPDGLLSGVGVTDSTIDIGVLVDTAADRGFTTGVELWRRTVNTSGGICGRTISTRTKTAAESMATGYARIAGSTLGLITLPRQADRAALSTVTSADQLPTLTLTG